MRILNLSVTDPAGAIINMVNAVNRYTEHTARLFTLQKIESYDFKEDFNIGQRVNKESMNEVLWWFKNADVVIIHKPQEFNWDKFILQYTVKNDKFEIPMRQIKKNKRVIYQHHGEPYTKMATQELTWKYKEYEPDLKIIVVTPDLLNIHHKAKYIPNCIPVYDTDYLPRHIDREGYIRLYDKEKDKLRDVRFLCYAPTPTCPKNNKEFDTVIKKLNSEFNDISPLVIQGMSQKDCLRLKRLAYAGFDHMQGWYGLNTLEFMSMGIPVLVGMNKVCLDSIYEFFRDNNIKWIPSEIVHNENEMEKKFKVLLEDYSYRQKVSEESRLFMENIWTEKYIAEKLIEYIKE